MTSAVSDNITAYNYGFAFDNIGNRSSSTIASTSTTYTANNLNQYTAITQGTTVNPTYNDDGCMLTNGKGWNNTWNAENRLIETYNDAVGYKLTFKYDYMGRRVEKKVYTGTSSTSWILNTHTKFVYDGYKCIEVLDGANSNVILQKFLWNGEELLSVYDVAATAIYYYFADANKNIGQLIDSSGNTVAQYEYSPFGIQTLSTGTYTSTNPFRFSSEYYDSETELVYYNYRYYSSTLGRWVSRDPIGEDGGINLYSFTENACVNTYDYLGAISVTHYDDIGTIDKSGRSDITGRGGFTVKPSSNNNCCCPSGYPPGKRILVQYIKKGGTWEVDSSPQEMYAGTSDKKYKNRVYAYTDPTKQVPKGGRPTNHKNIYEGFIDTPGYNLGGKPSAYHGDFRVEEFCRCFTGDFYNNKAVEFSFSRKSASDTKGTLSGVTTPTKIKTVYPGYKTPYPDNQ